MIVVISDTHRGITEHLAQSDALESFLDYNRSLKRTIIYNGDIVDLWAVGYTEAMDVDGKMIEMLGNYPDYIWTPGNHDSDIERMRLMFRLPEKIEEFATIGNRQIFHGHQLDSLLDSEYEREAVSFLDRIGYDLRFFGPVNMIRRMIDHAHRNNRELDFRSKPWGNVVVGHTHLAGVADCGRFINCGCWTGEEGFHYVLFDDEYNPGLVEWTKDGKEEVCDV